MSIKTQLQRAAFVLALSVSPAIAGGVRIVDPSGQSNFPDIQSAIDAAVDGDVLLVGAGTYPGFTLDGKGLSIFAVPAGSQGVQISGGVVVQNLLGKNAVLGGLSAGPLGVSNCSGYVALQDCSFTGPSGTASTLSGQPAGDIVQSVRVVLAGCTFHAGDWYVGNLWGGFTPGAYGLKLQSSTVALYDSTIVGGGGPGSYHDDPGPGGPGTRALSSWLFASRCSSTGGQGGDDNTSIPIVGGACGGEGMTIDAGSSVHLLDVSASGGAGGLPSWGCGGGPGISNQGGQLDLIPGTGRVFDLATISVDRARWSLSIAGVSGDQVFLNRSLAPLFQYEPALSGVCTSLLPPFAQVAPYGVVPFSGSLVVAARQRLLPDDVLARVNFLQGYVIETGGATVLGSPMHTLSLNWNAPPDCNANGIQDYAEVLAGLTPDVDHDLIPDGCP